MGAAYRFTAAINTIITARATNGTACVFSQASSSRFASASVARHGGRWCCCCTFGCITRNFSEETMNGLAGLDQIVSCEKQRRGVILGEDNDDAFADVVGELGGWGTSFDNLIGFDMNSISPYLSAFSSGFGGGDKKDDDKQKQEQERLRQEAERAKASQRTTLLVVLGLLGAAAVGTGIFVMARKKK
jgi:hypothetical protein